MLIQETAAVLFGEHASETPRLILEGLDVHDLDEEDVAGSGALDLEGAAQIVDAGEVHVENIVGRIVVPDLATSPTVRLGAYETHGARNATSGISR